MGDQNTRTPPPSAWDKWTAALRETERLKNEPATRAEYVSQSRENCRAAILAEARRHVREHKATAAAEIRRTEQSNAHLVFKTHVPRDDESGSDDQPVRRRRRRERALHRPHLEPPPRPAIDENDPWAGWEKWLRARLDAERSEIIAEVQAALTDSTRGVVDGTLDLADSLDQKILESNRELREQIHELKIEVARLVAVADELRKGQAPLDLPRLPLRPSREVN
jgi:cell division septum initiation protein DivIVA